MERDSACGKEDIEMKTKLLSNWGLKLISVLCAMILWLIVVNVDDPITTKKFKNIPVKILSENLISEAGQIYEILDESDKVTVTVKAKRSIVESLRVSDFKATADFAERVSENTIPIEVDVTKRSGDIEDIYLDNNTVKIQVEKKIRRKIPVEISISGKTAEGFTVGSTKVSPEEISIEGPESVINQVKKVVLPVDVNGASQDIRMTSAGEFYSEHGGVIKNSRIEGDISKIQCFVHLLHTKSIDLNVATSGEPAADYWCQDIQYSPTTITIAGEVDDLEKINTLVIPPEELNIDGAKKDIVKDIDVTKFLPDGVKILDAQEKKIKVTLIIKELDGKEFRIPMRDVGVLNTPSGMDVVLDMNDKVSVIIQGTSEDLNQLSRDDIQVSVNVKNKDAGSYNLEAEVTVPNGYVVVNKPMVMVVLEKLAQETDSVQETVRPQQPSNTVTETFEPQESEEVVEEESEEPTPTPTVESEEPIVSNEPEQSEEPEMID